MKILRQLLLYVVLAVCVVSVSSFARAEDGEPRELTKAAKKTLEILQTEKFDTITLDPGEAQKTFEIIKAKLAKRGVTVRLKHYGYGKEVSAHKKGEPLPLRNIPLDKFMGYFADLASWGWILYPDGSITYFDSQCACCWPKDGIYCHDGQYEAGKPEVMEREQKAAEEKPRAEQAPSDGDKP